MNFPEIRREALERVAVEVRGGNPAALVRHRPGRWEAEHVEALAAGAQLLSQPTPSPSLSSP